MYFYESDPYTLIALYRGSTGLNRDEILKVKGLGNIPKPARNVKKCY